MCSLNTVVYFSSRSAPQNGNKISTLKSVKNVTLFYESHLIRCIVIFNQLHLDVGYGCRFISVKYDYKLICVDIM